MPAEHTAKKDRARTTAASASTSKRPTPPSVSKLKKEWKGGLLEWVPGAQPFVHAEGTSTLTKTAAGKEYGLTDQELDTLPYEARPNPHSIKHPMRLYSVRDLRKLSDRKRAKLGTLATSRKNKATEPVVAWVSFGPQFKLSRREELIYEHYYPNPTPLLIHDYTTPAGCEESEPTPDKINWGGCQRVPTNVIAEDACLLYCLKPEDIQDLSQASPWINVKTLAMRAVRLHGGLKAHNELIRRKRGAEIMELESEHLRKSLNKLSKNLQECMKPSGDERMYEIPGHHHVCTACVEAYLPPIKECMDDHGCEWEWF